ncbi:GAP family protein [Actinomadura sp. WMMB 499]|uniref:GAP family protein n=1 Tax=Actinomadura sp. WMMB 499 TaxID=1219491 RepID=UPI0012472742|nr:GAP family protein [Actinomadura sp. WMMB 499]QFG23697.1 GAP family protein [Actinomadura sp. WMMB 499]
MGEVIGALLPLAVGIAVSPIPIIAVVLMLLAPRARETGPGFLAGWTAGVVAATTVLVLIADAIGTTAATGDPKTPVSVIVLLLGVLALVLAIRQWTDRPRHGAAADLPGWTRTIDRLTPARAASLGFLLSALNPKNLTMCVAAGVTVSQGRLGAGLQIVAVAAFTVLAVCTVAAPVIAYVAAPDRMRGPLDGLREWLERNSATVTSVLLLVIGVVLLGRGMGGLID